MWSSCHVSHYGGVIIYDEGCANYLKVSLGRIILEYANMVWSPLYKKEMKLIENVLHRATKMAPEYRHMDREARLRYLNLPSIYYRRARGDMIEVYKFLNGKYNVDYSKILLPLGKGSQFYHTVLN